MNYPIAEATMTQPTSQTQTTSTPSATDRSVPAESARDESPSPRSSDTTKQLRGFARMNKAKLQRIASEGGIAAQKSRLAHRFTSETASAAGKRGGHRIAQNRDYMKELGRRGGIAKGVSMAQKRAALATVQSGLDAGTLPVDMSVSRSNLESATLA